MGRCRLGDYAIYDGVNNFTNQEPDRGSLDTPMSPLGRFAYVGVLAKFDSIPFIECEQAIELSNEGGGRFGVRLFSSWQPKRKFVAP